MQGTLQTTNIVQFIRLLRLRWYGRTERLNNKRMPEWKEQGKEGAQKRWTDEVEENLKEMGIRLWHRVAREWMEWRRSVQEAKVHNRLYCLSIRLYQLMYHKYDLAPFILVQTTHFT